MLIDLLNELESLGFYRYTPPEQIQIAKEEALQTHYIYGEPDGELVGRAFIADEEDLAEGAVDDFIDGLRPFLERQGAIITRVAQTIRTGDGYIVEVNGRPFVMYSEEELESDRDLWDVTARRAVAMVNVLLHEVDSTERLYRLWRANDAEAIFLTQEQYEAIRGSWDIKPFNMPSEYTRMPPTWANIKGVMSGDSAGRRA